LKGNHNNLKILNKLSKKTENFPLKMFLYTDTTFSTYVPHCTYFSKRNSGLVLNRENTNFVLFFHNFDGYLECASIFCTPIEHKANWFRLFSISIDRYRDQNFNSTKIMDKHTGIQTDHKIDQVLDETLIKSCAGFISRADNILCL
jgi:hypothetical protein